MPKVLFVNTTRQCNVDCPRCYLTPEHRAAAERLSPARLKRILDHPFWGDSPLVIFQGGEPSILGESSLSDLSDAVLASQPGAVITMVTNLLNMPDWLVAFARERFDNQIETTYALGAKHLLNGDSQGYQERFRNSLGKAISAGIRCPVNVELNHETTSRHASDILNIARETGATQWEFDISIQFDRFRMAPLFAAGRYPMLPLSIPYAEFAGYIHALSDAVEHECMQEHFSSSLLADADERAARAAFNVQREADFLTINPDGTVTTNPLFSDIAQTYLGNIDDGLDAILNHPNRLARIEWEQQRLAGCSGCQHLRHCKGGPSHAPVFDGSGECAGLRTVWSRINKRSGLYGAQA